MKWGGVKSHKSHSVTSGKLTTHQAKHLWNKQINLLNLTRYRYDLSTIINYRLVSTANTIQKTFKQTANDNDNPSHVLTCQWKSKAVSLQSTEWKLLNYLQFTLKLRVRKVQLKSFKREVFKTHRRKLNTTCDFSHNITLIQRAHKRSVSWISWYGVVRTLNLTTEWILARRCNNGNTHLNPSKPNSNFHRSKHNL